MLLKKSRIRETPTLSTDADIRTNTNLKRLHDLSLKKMNKNQEIADGRARRGGRLLRANLRTNERPQKKSHGKGTDRQTNTRTCRLLDQLGPEGRIGEMKSGICT